MLNEDRIRIMTDMAIYEAGKGKQEFRINRYFKRDYIGLNMIYTFLWVTIGYALIMAMYGVTHFDLLLDGLTDLEMLKALGIKFAIGYVAVLLFYLIVLRIYYGLTHRRASGNVREYFAQLRRIEKLYAQEEGILPEDDDEENERGGRR